MARPTNAMPIDQVDSSESSASQSNEVRLLKHSWARTIKMKKFSILKDQLTSTNPMINTIGLHGITRKIDSYTNCDEFLADIDALVRSYSLKFSAQPDAKGVVAALAELCHRDVRSIRTCSDCFEYWANDSQNYFTKVCTKPHLIVYAKVDGCRKFWPAKVMSVNGNMVNVEFFGDHTQDDVRAEKCVLYTRHTLRRKNASPFNDAILELDGHIKNIEEKFGPMCRASSKITLDPKNVEKQLMTMIPGAFKRSPDVERAASNEAQPNVDEPGESLGNVPTSNRLPLNDESNGIRMQSGQGGLGQKRSAPLRNEETASAVKKATTAHGYVALTAN
ncbi:MYND-type zinc finger-containing chromatin reader Zmynd8-like [Sitodiplosis mosellana]|uniref:MYND-type zinc finger-containing chromatin reader Zmynd8-like n=1 Tax=Sitodiplosis mosellana TaxID=263140 RepID=UPI0024448826|nr:MYND-type zinc finger-containing chromatin reader Zmynd8-like [Sitodiplosis mosellana]